METHDVFEEKISNEEEKKEEDLKLSVSHEGEDRHNRPSQPRLVPILASPCHRCSLSHTFKTQHFLSLVKEKNHKSENVSLQTDPGRVPVLPGPAQYFYFSFGLKRHSLSRFVLHQFLYLSSLHRH